MSHQSHQSDNLVKRIIKKETLMTGEFERLDTAGRIVERMTRNEAASGRQHVQ
jgi:hypothetical protein